MRDGHKNIYNFNCNFVQMYLMKYGYMDMAGGSGKSAPLLSKDGLRNYIREFQVGWKLKVFLQQIGNFPIFGICFK